MGAEKKALKKKDTRKATFMRKGKELLVELLIINIDHVDKLRLDLQTALDATSSVEMIGIRKIAGLRGDIEDYRKVIKDNHKEHQRQLKIAEEFHLELRTELEGHRASLVKGEQQIKSLTQDVQDLRQLDGTNQRENLRFRKAMIAITTICSIEQ